MWQARSTAGPFPDLCQGQYWSPIGSNGTWLPGAVPPGAQRGAWCNKHHSRIDRKAISSEYKAHKDRDERGYLEPNGFSKGILQS